jgi:hypothetical protein
MNFPRLKKVFIKGVGMVEIRPYLTTNEINAILDAIQQESDFATRRMMMYSMTMPLCTNLKDFESDEVDLDMVEAYYLNGIFDRIIKHIKGFDILKEGVNNLPISEVSKRFEDAIEDFTKQFKDIDLNKSMKQFEAELGKLKEVEKQKEEILSGK